MNRNRIYMPGEIICSANQKKAGRGTYQDGNDIKAAIIGKQALIESEVILVSLYNDEDQPELRVGSLILGEVVRIKEDRAILKILKIDNKRFNGQLEGVIRKQNARAHEVDKLNMNECFLPGDRVLARMISLGDSRTVLLSTAEDNLGVVFASSKESGKLMIPLSFDEMLCLQSGLKEKRIVAKPNFEHFKAA